MLCRNTRAPPPQKKMQSPAAENWEHALFYAHTRQGVRHRPDVRASQKNRIRHLARARACVLSLDTHARTSHPSPLFWGEKKAPKNGRNRR